MHSLTKPCHSSTERCIYLAGKCKQKYCPACAPPSNCACWDGSYCSSCAPATSNCQSADCLNGSCKLCSTLDPESERVCATCALCEAELCVGCRRSQCEEDLKGACPGCLRLCAAPIIRKLLTERDSVDEEREAERKQMETLQAEIEVLQQKIDDMQVKADG